MLVGHEDVVEVDGFAHERAGFGVGSRGLEQIIQLNLTVDERAELMKSASAVKELSAALK